MKKGKKVLTSLICGAGIISASALIPSCVFKKDIVKKNKEGATIYLSDRSDFEGDLEQFSQRGAKIKNNMKKQKKEMINVYPEIRIGRWKKIEEYIDDYYLNFEVPELINKDFVRTIIKVESNGKADAKSWAGAKGLMQLMKLTWKEVSKKPFSEADNPIENINAGIKHLIGLQNYSKEKYPNWKKIGDKSKRDLIAAAYNGGGPRLKYRNWKISRMPNETRNYVKKINKIMDEEKAKQTSQGIFWLP